MRRFIQNSVFSTDTLPPYINCMTHGTTRLGKWRALLQSFVFVNENAAPRCGGDFHA